MNGAFSHTFPDVRWLGPSRYCFIDTINNDLFKYTASNGRVVYPPQPFIFDFGSVPMFCTRLFPRDEFGPAYLTHDVLCAFGKTTIDGDPVTFAEANWILYDAIYALCVQMPSLYKRAWKRFPVYAGVTVGGWYAWNNHNDGRAKAFPYFP